MSFDDTPTQAVIRKLRDPARVPVRILCIEDNDADFVLIRELLVEAGFAALVEIQRAKTMSEAGRLLEADGAHGGFDIALLDLKLPDSDGVDTYRRLRTLAPRIAVAILSGIEDENLALDLLQQGAQDYLPKNSLTPDLLMRCIVYAMKRQRHRVEMEKLSDRLQQTSEELRTTQKQLIHAEKVESLGRLASSVAHEVKNPLGVIQMGLDYLRASHLDDGEEVKRTLDLMQEAIVRADSIIYDMLNFSRSDERRMQSCDLNNVAGCVVRMMKHEINRRGITLRVELAPSPLQTQCEPTEIEQVIINLVTNSLHAMEKGRVLTLRTRVARADAVPRDEGLREMNVLRTGDEVVIIEVQDEGPGIPANLMDRVLEPFFTTKPTGEGTGLGLSVCKRIVELHRGQLILTNVETPRGLLASVMLKAETSTPQITENHNGASHKAAAPIVQTTTL